jgi:hypothetical protein
MPDPPAVTVLTRNTGRTHAHGRLHLASPSTPPPSTTLVFDGVESVEIVAPDRYCALILLDHAIPTFPAELAPGPGWIVRFQAPPTEETG